MDKEIWYHCIIYDDVGTGSACGFASLNGVIIKAAPTFSWMIGKTLKEIKPYLLSKNAIVSEVKSDYKLKQ